MTDFNFELITRKWQPYFVGTTLEAHDINNYKTLRIAMSLYDNRKVLLSQRRIGKTDIFEYLIKRR